MLENSDGTPIGASTKWYDSGGQDPLPQQQLSFLSWINPFNSTNQSAKSSNKSNSSNSCSETSETDEYRGVQGLKQFWNNRISAIKDPKHKAATLTYGDRLSDQCNLNGSKSIQCFSGGDSGKRSSSFCDSSDELLDDQLDRANVDNFYKYKTASSKKRCSLSAASDLKKLNSYGVNFPLVAATSKGEKIHWARRDEIFTNRKQKDSTNLEQPLEKTPTKTKITSEGTCAIAKDNEQISPRRISRNNKPNEMAIKSGDKRDSGRSQSGSTNSLSSESPVRKTNSTSRKYSFKTHSKNYHTPRKMTSGSGSSKVAALTHRFNQLIQQDAAILEEVKRNNGILMSTSGHVYKVKGGSSESGRKKMPNRGSGTDEELSSVKGSSRKKLSFKKRISGSAKQQKVSNETMTVKAAIKRFETNSESPTLTPKVATDEKPLPAKQSTDKPKIPSKSEYVLQRTKEAALRNSLRKNKLHVTTAELRVTTPHQILAEIQEEEKPQPIETSAKTDATVPLPDVDQMELSVPDSVLLVETAPSTVDVPVTPPGSPEPEETQTKRNKYARLYEKFRFRSPFTTKKSPLLFSNTPPTESSMAPDQKIIDALDSVNKKLEHLSKSTSDIRRVNDEDRLYEQMTANMKPNESFLFRNNTKPNTSFTETAEDCEQSQQLVEAVNTRLINKTQSMDESRFPSMNFRQVSLEERDYPVIFQETDKLLSSFKHSSDFEELYEPIAPPTEKHSDVTISQVEVVKQTRSIEDENIYQTLTEVKNAINRKDCDSVNSYESYANYESVEDDPKIESSENSYEICDPPEPPPPRKVEPDIRINGELLPALPIPKRILPINKLPPDMKYTKIPPRPPKSPRNDPDRNHLPELPLCLRGNFDSEDEVNNDCEENIYDTIKLNGNGSHCYESITSKGQPKSLDAISMVSNCYESISSLRRLPPLQHSDSISTLSSDQKTNSLYGMTLGQSATPPSEGASSDNSEDWVTDLSDDETQTRGSNSANKFIVVRERAKCHRSPDWSKKVRDRRIHRQSEILDGDDSDHLYEPLYNVGPTDQNLSQNGGTNTTNGSAMPEGNYTRNNNSGNCYSDEYDDSFSDEETDEDVKKNDSGVDISNVRLPDPPPTTNQVYAFVKKIKNFGSLSKSLSKISIRKSTSSLKTPETPTNKYENTQFYVGHDYQNTSFDSQKSSKVKTPKTLKKSLKLPKTSDDPYENTEFHTPRTPTNQPTTQTPEAQSSPLITPILNVSDRSLSEAPGIGDAVISRKKSKSGKSFKSKFRKSLAGPEPSLSVPNAFNATRSTFYISDSVDMDSGIFEKTTPHSEPNLSQSTNELLPTDKTAPVVRKTKKSLSSPDLNRRRTTIGVRPSNPPPPPPIDKKALKEKHASTTSWYTECGVFKPNSLGEELMLSSSKDARHDRSSNTSWYAEAGLYQTSGASVASSSGSSGVSTGGEGGPGDDNSHSMFLNEPLYQIYSAAKLESITDIEDQESIDGYEEIGALRSSREERKSKRPSAFQLIGPRQGPSRTLWSEIPEVQNSDSLSTLSPVEKRLQEAKFEILTSEASYLKSLNLLKKHFMGHPAFRDTNILSGSDRKTLFASILPVQECSDRLLCDLENCWQDNIMLLGLSKSIYKHAEKYFHVYVSFCENQGKMDRTLRRLKEAKGTFSQHLEALECDPECCGLNLHSFLMLPMQRITRLPLLIDAVFSKLKPDDDEFEDWQMTLGILNKIVSQCNDAANRCEQAYEIERISRQIEFPSNIRSLAIAPVGIPAAGKKPRSLVKKGELVQLIWRGDDGKLTFGKKFVKCNIFVFLFTDLLVLTKRKGDELFVTFDYCPRSMLSVSSGEVIPQLPTKEVVQAGKNLILMTLLENHEGKTIELILSCPSVSEQQRWLEATKPPESENPDETLYEQWDCPQVMVKHEFIATEPDLLSLQLGDVINVNRKMTDGWYQGERIRDGASGWFPGNFTEEVNSPHVRARNLKQRYRLLTLTASYLESQKKK